MATDLPQFQVRDDLVVHQNGDIAFAIRKGSPQLKAALDTFTSTHGEGAVGAGHYPKLAGNLTLPSWRYVALIVLGRRNGMPAFSAPANRVWDGPTAHLSDAQVADVVNYVRSHFGNPYKDRVTASEVAKLPHPATAAAP